MSLNAANLYWVGGTGTWNDPQHWSASSGGPAGGAIPTLNDDVFFDQHSFSADKQTVKMTADAVCRNMDWTSIDDKAIFSSAASKSLTVYGSYKLSGLLSFGFKGKTVFSSSQNGNTISTAGRIFIGDVVFDGAGNWALSDDLTTDPLISIHLLRGGLSTNGQTVTCGYFIGNSIQPRSLNLSSSKILVHKTWDFSSPGNLAFNAGNSSILLKDIVDPTTFRSGDLLYNDVGVMVTFCTPSGTPCTANLVITMAALNITCNGLCNGSAWLVSVTGGSGTYSYDWQGTVVTPAGDFTDSIFNLCAGNYTIKVTDVGSGLFCFCNINVTEPSVLFDYELFSTQPSCNGICDGTAGLDATGGTPPYTYAWTPGGYTNDTVLTLCDDVYDVVVTDVNGCVGNTPLVITEPPVLVAPGSFTNVTCSGLCNGTASVVASGGSPPYTYSWAPGTPTGDGTANITNLCPGSYTCTVTDTSLCTATYIATITEPPVLTLSMSQTNATCGGLCDGTATATVSGGTVPYTYSWSNGTTITTASVTSTISGLCAGSFTVVVTDGNGCVKTDSVLITEPPVLVAVTTVVNVTCFGLCNGTATAVPSGGNGGNTFDWTPGAPTGDGTATITGLCPGTYTVTVTDINGCTATATAIITEPPVLAANPVGTNILCFGVCNGSATSTPTGGTIPYTYNWSGTPIGDLTPTITALCPGLYSVTVTDLNLCTSVQSVTITEPTIINTGLSSTNVSCNGACNGTATSAPSGGTGPYTASWTGPAGFTSTALAISGLCPGIYTVTVSDANACTQTGSVTITQPNILTVTATSTTLSCNGDCDATATAVLAGGTAPYTINWTPGAPIGDGTTTISSLCAGTYTVTVTDANGCTATATTTITQPTVLTLVTAVTNVSCFGLCNGTAAAIGGGGTPPYSFSWSPGGQTTSSITGLCAGSYTVCITDFNGCSICDTVIITQPTQIFANPSVVSNISCAGAPCNGSATSAPTGGTAPYTYNWGPGTPSGELTPTITSLCAGTYNVVVTDSNLCSSTMPVTITTPLVLSAPITGSTSSCNICNGTATVTPAGGTGPYTYLWSDPLGQTTATATGLCPNITYTVTVTDANLCTALGTVTIMQTITISITTSDTSLSCFGACDGIVTANAGGGTAPYSYIWTGPICGGAVGVVSLTQTATGLGAGTYTVNVSDAAGCFNTDTVTFTNPPQLVTAVSFTNLTCAGVCTGTGTATPSGGTGAYTYSWMPGGQTTQTATGLCAGTYTVTIADANSCSIIDSVTITQPTPVIDNATITAANCTFADGSISVVAIGGAGAGTYAYNWGPDPITGDGTATVTNLLPGAYTLAITSGGCTYNFNYLVGNITGPTLVMTHTDVSCNTVCDGTATITASGGAPGYTYLWSPGGAITPSVTGLCGTATYTVTVTDAAGCINLDTARVIEPLFISPNPTVVNESCGGSCDGSISLAPSGGTAGYTYAWSTGASTPSISGLCAGPYTFTVTDANGCDSTLTITITAPPVLSLTATFTNVLCNSACNGTATATPVGGSGPFTYSWSHGPAIYILANVVALCPGSYTVTVTDANLCTATASVTITEPTPLITVTSQTPASCFGVCDGTAIVTASGGTIPYTYSWMPGAIANDTASGLCAGTYFATVTDANLCVNTTPGVTILQPAPIVPNAVGTNATCNASCNGSATANPTGGSGTYTYSWNSVPVQNTQTATGLCAGTYIVTVNDGSCSMTQSISLTDPPVLNANPTATSPTCANDCDGSVISNPVGGTGTYTYSWSPVAAVTQSVSGLCPMIYTVIVTDGNNCKDTASVTMINPAGIDVTIGSTPANCGAADGTISITPTTGTAPYTYVWTIGGVAPPLPFAGNGTPNVTNVGAGLYDVLVTDVNGCDSTFTIPMNNSSGPTGAIVSTTIASCFGVCDASGSIDSVIGGTAPYTYLWDDPLAQTNDTAVNLCDSVYFVQITDAAGCIYFSPVIITEPAQILANAVVTSALCSNVCTGAITVTPTGGTGGYSYFWAPGVIVGQGTSTVTGLCPGTYTLTITDANLCVKVDSFVVTQSTPLTATIGSTSISCSSACSGSAYITITSGTAPFSIQWNDAFGQTTDTATALCSGNYSVDITDANGCILTLSTTITATPAVTANAVITGATCGLCDGSAALAPTGGTPTYTYLWSNGQTTANATALCSGLYTVNITDSSGCVTSVSIPVNNTSGPSSASITSTNITCNGACNGAVTAVSPVGGTAPYTFLWIASGSTASTLSGLCAGTYFVQTTDANGCSLIDSVIITEPSPILANQVITAATCGACDGSITISPSGGTGPYTVLWNTGSTSLSLINLCAGVYSVAITDATGCVQNVVIPVNSQDGPTLSASSINVTCNGSCNGLAGVVATGVSPYSYLWNDLGLQTTDSTTATLCAGTYFVQVTDANLCVTIASTTITEPDSIGFSVANAIDPLCNGNANGSITTIPSGGTLSYTYSWTPFPAAGQSTSTASGLDANTYIVTVTDANGCAASQTVTLVSPVSLTISNATVPSSCNTIADGSIDVTVGGGTLPYVYQWSGGSSAVTEDLTNILSGSYTITVTDLNSCIILDTIVLLPAQTVIASAGNDTSFCQSGLLTLSAAASVNGTTYQWFDMTNTLLGSSSTLTFNPATGTNSFYVVVDNGTGCSDSDTVDVTSNPLPSANAGVDVTIVIGANTTIGGSPTTNAAGATIQWTPTPGALDNSTAANPLATPTVTTTYTVTVTSAQGCVASDSIVVTVRPGIVFPDGISPNADGANDEWIIDGIEFFPDCVVEVYNRWGELLFQSVGYKENWKGTYKGKPLPVGTYYYIIDLKDPLFPDVYTGPITILR